MTDNTFPVRVELVTASFIMPMDKAMALHMLLQEATPVRYEYSRKEFVVMDIDVWEGMGKMVLCSPAQQALLTLNGEQT